MSPELPEIQCMDCDAIFTVIWNRSLETEGGPQYCPFCGAEDPFIPEENIERQ
jgi:Zn finger protein HypA/HybF involved in hydrogenase expression